jgi:hypothetical protein
VPGDRTRRDVSRRRSGNSCGAHLAGTLPRSEIMNRPARIPRTILVQWLFWLLIPLTLIACTSEQAEEPRARSDEAPGTTAMASPAARDVGAIAVRVTYAGAPVTETIRVNKDTEQCGKTITIEKLATGPDGGLVNAVISVADVKGSGAAPTRHAQPRLDQAGCTFRPHVVAMQAGDLEVLNSDGILHNFHTTSKANPVINKAQPKFKKSMTVTLSEPEIVEVACDVHSWMQAWVAVFAHPYFAVTDAKGTARIADVPAGAHTLELWHEVLGRRTREVEVKSGQTTEVAFDWEKS